MQIPHDVLIAAISSGVTTVGVVVKHYINKRSLLAIERKKDNIWDAIKVNAQVSNTIDDLREQYGADRVSFTQFHNGGNFYPSGNSIPKLSMFYESLATGVDSIQSKYQSIPVSLFSKSIDYLLDNHYILVPDHKRMPDQYARTRYILEDGKLKSSYRFAIKSLNGKYMGILGFDYYKKRKTLSDEDIYNISSVASGIGGVLMSTKSK